VPPVAPLRTAGKRRQEKLAKFPTASGGISRLAYEQAIKSGLDANRLVQAARLTVQQVTDDGVQLPVKNQIEFLNLVASASRNEFLGMRLAQDVDLRQLGLLYYVMASSPTLADALRRVERYSGITNEAVRLVYRQHRSASVTFQYAGVSRSNDSHQIEFFVTTLVRVCRHLLGRQVTPDVVRFIHRRAGLPMDLKSFFGCPVTFGNDVDEVAYSTNFAGDKIVSADPFLNSLLERYCEEALAGRRTASGDWRPKVENAMAQLLPHGQARMPEVCKRLGVSARTLSRRLESEGLTFAEVLDRLRCDLAKRYLREPHLPMSEIAWLLGYQQTSSFDHAFKRWTGKSPGDLRATG
jgi:AraC-like DNA-binding protein